MAPCGDSLNKDYGRGAAPNPIIAPPDDSLTDLRGFDPSEVLQLLVSEPSAIGPGSVPVQDFAPILPDISPNYQPTHAFSLQLQAQLCFLANNPGSSVAQNPTFPPRPFESGPSSNDSGGGFGSGSISYQHPTAASSDQSGYPSPFNGNLYWDIISERIAEHSLPVPRINANVPGSDYAGAAVDSFSGGQISPSKQGGPVDRVDGDRSNNGYAYGKALNATRDQYHDALIDSIALGALKNIAVPQQCAITRQNNSTTGNDDKQVFMFTLNQGIRAESGKAIAPPPYLVTASHHVQKSSSNDFEDIQTDIDIPTPKPSATPSPVQRPGQPPVTIIDESPEMRNCFSVNPMDSWKAPTPQKKRVANEETYSFPERLKNSREKQEGNEPFLWIVAEANHWKAYNYYYWKKQDKNFCVLFMQEVTLPDGNKSYSPFDPECEQVDIAVTLYGAKAGELSWSMIKQLEAITFASTFYMKEVLNQCCSRLMLLLENKMTRMKTEGFRKKELAGEAPLSNKMSADEYDSRTPAKLSPLLEHCLESAPTEVFDDSSNSDEFELSVSSVSHDSPISESADEHYSRMEAILFSLDNLYSVETAVENNSSDEVEHSVSSVSDDSPISESVDEYDSRIEASFLSIFSTDNLYSVETAVDDDSSRPEAVELSVGKINDIPALLDVGVEPNGADSLGETQLHMAASRGDTRIIKLLIENGANVDAIDENRKTPCDIALENRNFDVVELLLGVKKEQSLRRLKTLSSEVKNGHVEVVQEMLIGMHLGNQNAEANTLLCDAASQGNVAMIEILLRHGANIDGRCALGKTPLHHAASCGQEKATKLLLQLGAAIAQDKFGDTPLHEAVRNNHVGVIEILLGHSHSSPSQKRDSPRATHSGGDDDCRRDTRQTDFQTRQKVLQVLDTCNMNGETPLIIAVENAKLEIVQLLLEKGSKGKVNEKSRVKRGLWDCELTPLLAAIMEGHEGIVRLLLQHNAHLNETTEATHGSFKVVTNPLFCAARKGFQDIAHLLLEYGADANEQDDQGWTALHIASHNGHTQIVHLLVENGATIESRTDMGETPLHRAVFSGNLDVVSLLIDKGADIESVAKNGRRPLHLAACNDDIAIARLLLEKGADVGSRAEVGWTPLHFAADRGHVEIARLLILKGAAVGSTTKVGWTPLHYATDKGHVKIAQLLIENGATVQTTGLMDLGSRVDLKKDADLYVWAPALQDGRISKGRGRAPRFLGNEQIF
ncbi:hypothetical protein HDU96_004442 [Phlyctochytrium bullatum]|nr:hypothetical protein HDU96_004442 [Phlyctochytrium bullatum]